MAFLRDFEEALDLVERTVRDLLAAGGIEAPPVDPFEIARRSGVTVTERHLPGRRGQNFVRRGVKHIEVHDEDRPERKNLTVAHELFELELPAEVGDRRERHTLARLGAPRLLLPTEWFREACVAHRFDLFELKREFHTASHEVIAVRMLDVSEGAIVVIDNGKVRAKRTSGRCVVPRSLLPEEQAAAAEAVAGRHVVTAHFEGGTITATPVLEPGHERAILRITFDDVG